ncbi:hypothetical protein [Vibrio chagasii]|uniref:hypothetical protein n=1 Tax=Vibrio chagasii TaxID=170679 RepID=UPI003DA16146
MKKLALALTLAAASTTATANTDELFNYGHIYGYYKTTSAVVCADESTPNINRLSRDFKAILNDINHRAVILGYRNGDKQARLDAASAGVPTAKWCAISDSKAKKIVDSMNAG